MKRIPLIILSIAALLLAACDDARNQGSIEVPTKTSLDGIRYKLVKIEGHTFVATQGYRDYWTLAGPIN